MRLRSLLVIAGTCMVGVVVGACSDDSSSTGLSSGGASSSSSSSSGGASSGTSGSSGNSGESSSGSSGTSGGTSGSSGTTPASDAELCVATINKYRTDMGLPAYTRWTANESCTDGQAESDGKTKKAHGAFGTCGENAQNECPGWPAPASAMIGDCLAMMMDEGPGGGHYDTMTSTRYTQVSCGFATSADGKIWAVQNFK